MSDRPRRDHSQDQNIAPTQLETLPFSLRAIGKVITLLSRSGEEPNKKRLISISISHYVEKVRWALDNGSSDYTEDGHLPGIHSFFTVPVTKGPSMTPCLVTRDPAVPFLTDSTEILKYLCKNDPALSFLYPSNKAKEVENLEEYFDQNLGVPVRRFVYSYALPREELIHGLLQSELPWVERALIGKFVPTLKIILARVLSLELSSDKVVQDTAKQITEVYEKVNALLSDGRQYLVGDKFTAADLTFAALSYPFVASELQEMFKFRVPAPIEAFPEKYREQVGIWMKSPAGRHAIRMYAEHRFPQQQEEKVIRMRNPNSRNNFLPLLVPAFFLASAGAVFFRSRL